MVPHPFKAPFVHLILRIQHPDKIDGKRFSLVRQLEERVLCVGARLPEDDRTGRVVRDPVPVGLDITPGDK